MEWGTHPPSRPREFHPEPLTEPCVNLSIYTARATAWKAAAFRHCVEFLLLPVDPTMTPVTCPLRSADITPASSLLRGSPPLIGASVLSASCSSTCAFSLSITD